MKRTVILLTTTWACLALVAVVATGSENDTEAPGNEVNAAAAVARFTAEHPQARLYSSGARVTRVYGTPLTFGASPEDSANQFRVDQAAMFGVQADDLRPESLLQDGRHTQPVMFNRESGEYKFTLVYYSQYEGELPVFRSDLRLLVRNKPGYPLVLAAANLRNLGAFSATIDAVAPQAVTSGQQAAQKAVPGVVNFTQPRLVIWAGVDDETVQPAEALVFVGDNGQPTPHADKWLFVTDAATGDVLYQEDQILEEDVIGSVKGKATQGVGADICEPVELENMSYARVNIGATNSFADVNGDFVIPNAGTDQVTVQSPLVGQYFEVFNDGGSESLLTMDVLPPGPADFVHNQADLQGFVRAETTGYVEANVVRDVIVETNPLFPVIPGQTGFDVRVNQSGGICPGNAQYTGNAINFCAPGSGYPNMAFSSVVYHEYGHHVVAVGGSGQSEYGEGMSDVVSVLILDDPRVGYGFFGNCNSSLRSADNNCSYLPSGCSTCGSAIHTCGQLLSGCAWDTRNELVLTEPDNYQQIVLDLAINSVLMHSGSSITPQITIDWLVLDDDDENIDNGTPHYAEIATGFGAHDMDAPPLAAVDFEYPAGRPAIITPGETTVVPVVIVPISDDPVPGTGVLRYRIGTQSLFAFQPMEEVAPNEYEGTLPATPCGDFVQYYFTVEAASAGLISDPADGSAAPYETTAADGSTTIFADDFELDQGWQVSSAGGLTDGQWDRGVPISGCNRGNPPTDADGTGQCYVTDNSAADACNSDVDGGSTILTSPNMDASQENMSLAYYRWYSNTAGGSPMQDVFTVQISLNGGASWAELETVGPAGAEVDGGWIYKEFKLADIPDFVPTTQFQVRFIASDADPQSVVEAGVDGVTLFKLDCEEACPADLNADGSTGAEDLALLLGAWGPNPGSAADLDGDGVVEAPDLALLLGAWGPCL